MNADALLKRLGYGRMPVSEGWHPILIKLNEKLAELDPDFTYAQIKEKFGGLRVYIEPSDSTDHATAEMMHRLARVAESESLTVCMVCGAPGKRGGTSWIITACEEHME